MNSPHGPDSDRPEGPSHQMVTTNDPATLASSAWVPPSPMWLDGAPGEEGLDFSVFLHCLRRRWLPGLLIGGAMASLAAGLLFFLIPVSYEAISLVRVKRTQPYLMEKVVSSDQEYMAYKQTQATLMTSPFVLTAALRQPGIEQLPMIRAENEPAGWLADELRVFYPGDSEIMQISMSGDSGEDLKKIVDAVVDAYLYEIALSEKTEKSDQLQMLRTQRRANEQAIKEKSDIVHNLAEEIGTPDSDMARLRYAIEQENLVQLSRQRAAIRNELATLRSDTMALNIAANGARFYKPDQMDVEILLEQDQAYAAAKQTVSFIQQQLTLMASTSRSRGGMLANPYQAELAVAQQTMAQRRAELTPMLEHTLKKEYGMDSNTSATTMQVLQGQAQLKQQQLQAISEEYDAQLEKVQNLSGFSADLIARKAELQSLHETNHEVAKEIARLELELRTAARIDRVQQATIPNEGSYVLKIIEIVGGAMVTLVVTLFGVALWDYKAKRLNSGKDLESTCRLPVIGTVPSMRSGVSGLLGSRATSETVIADSIDSIRAAIMYGAPGREVRTVLITSAVGHEGKSTIASQLAVSLARSGHRTLLIDADVRNPQQHAVFGLPLDRGFCDVVRGQATLEEVVQATPAEGLWILPAGRCDMATMQAMSSPVVPAIMDRVSEQFEFVILDSGPVLTGPEAMIYGQYVDAAILATRRDVSRVPKVDEAYRRLQSVGIHVIGAVVNGARSDVRSNQLALTSSVG